MGTTIAICLIAYFAVGLVLMLAVRRTIGREKFNFNHAHAWIATIVVLSLWLPIVVFWLVCEVWEATTGGLKEVEED